MGESVRVLYTTAAIGSGLLLVTGVIQADEHLDAATRDCQSVDDCLNALYDLLELNRDHGKTIVVVTHAPKAAEYASHTLHPEPISKSKNLVETGNIAACYA